MRYIILCADDFGRSHERNLAIDYAFKHGIIKCAGLIVNTAFTQEAIDMAKSGGYIEHLHLHFNLSSDKVLGGSGIPVSEEIEKDNLWCSNGKFRNSIKKSDEILLRHSKVVFIELQAQYQRFVKLTENKGNYNHIDFHLYHNFRLPVAYALKKMAANYDIYSARYDVVNMAYTASMLGRIKQILSKILSRHRKVAVYKSCRINFFLNRPELLNEKIIELFCHPDYVNGKLIDNTTPVFGNTKETLEKHVDMIKEHVDCEFISWKDLN